jgi:hypothetical protein
LTSRGNDPAEPDDSIFAVGDENGDATSSVMRVFAMAHCRRVYIRVSEKSVPFVS